ncbi:hypothetical protein AMATHDRAFT_62000 [Amanita thiersii Skay4041]|uniref:Protein kinase domain-containing protein n=1 Tax=Amanita thiersii Skay4041 TaxID=703135 RepID=A0A2A9NIT0_9AGAR|nr:hypothetical protein AMATHDRAFT_62000 [Amanita thiersii Skay4041]
MDAVNRYPTRKEPAQGVFPFATCVGSIVHSAPRTRPHVAFAQDSQNRHVVIKLVVAGTQEAKIVEFLRETTSQAGIDSFQGVIPVLDILHYGDYLFFVTPRWTHYEPYSSYATVEQALHFVDCMLRGLSFLHNNHIVHKDIGDHNILMNYFPSDLFDGESDISFRRDMRSQGLMRYAIFDFNLSIRLPASVLTHPHTVFQFYLHRKVPG